MTEAEQKWRFEAKRYAMHIWMYPDLIDDFPETTTAAIEAGMNPYDYVEALGEKYDLERVDQSWGHHSGVKFTKRGEMH